MTTRLAQSAALSASFGELFDAMHSERFISSDPIQFPHQYTRPADVELVAFISSVFAYGAATQICRAVSSILRPMGAQPHEFLMSLTERDLVRTDYWQGFYYRFHKENHLRALLIALQRSLRRHGSLESFFYNGISEISPADFDRFKRLDENSARIGAALLFAARELQSQMHLIATESGWSNLEHGTKFFVNAPLQSTGWGSACKRQLMFFRWMVRHDVVDFGVWKSFSPTELLVPVDTHVSRISHFIGARLGTLSTGTSWKMAVEITQFLRKIDPTDPVKFDFALTRLGILDVCKKKWSPDVCPKCSLVNLCVHGGRQKNAKPERV